MRRHGYLIATLMLLSLSGCTISRAMTPASLADLDEVQEGVKDHVVSVVEEQRDTYIRAKADGAEDPVATALDAGVRKAETADDITPVTGSISPYLEALMSWILDALGIGGIAIAGTTAASRRRRGVGVLSGKKKTTRRKAS